MRFLLIILISFFVNASVFAVKPLEDYQFNSDQWKAEVNRYLDDRLDQACFIYAGEKHVKTLAKIEKELAFLRSCFERATSFQHPQMSQVQQQQVINLTGNRPCEEAGLLFTPPLMCEVDERINACKRYKRDGLLTFLHHENEDGIFTYFGWGTAYTLGVWLFCYVNDLQYIYEFDGDAGSLLALLDHDIIHLFAYFGEPTIVLRNELSNMLTHAQTPEDVSFIGSYYHEGDGRPEGFVRCSKCFQVYFLMKKFHLGCSSSLALVDMNCVDRGGSFMFESARSLRAPSMQSCY